MTDTPRMHRAVGALNCLSDVLLGREEGTAAVENPSSAYVHLTLSAALRPAQPENLGVRQLVNFRERHRAELRAFREHVDQLAGSLRDVAAVEHPQVAEAHLRSIYESETLPQLNDLRGAMRGLGIDSVLGALELKVDLGAASGTALGVAATAGGHPVLGTAAVALSVVPYVAGRVKERQQKRADSPVAYLLAAERYFARRH